MKNSKKTLVSVLACLMALAGCGTSNAKTASATATGFGGEVRVELTVSKNEVTNITIVGDKETPNVGGVAIEKLQNAMKEAKSVDVDAVSGATVTSNAVLKAAKEAYATATGADKEKVEVKMTPGTYVGTAPGFRSAWDVEVSVTVDETKILSVEVNPDSADTVGIFQNAAELMPGRIVDTQSVSIDAVCGATVSSNAIKNATRNALLQALENKEAIEAFEVATVKSTETVTLETDVLIVGLGAAGTTAALSAVETMYAQDPSNVNVLAIDKAGRYGGASSLCAGVFAVNPEGLQGKYNDGKDLTNRDALLQEWVTYTEGDQKTEMVEFLLDNSGATLDWLVSSYGLELEAPSTGLTETDSNIVLFSYAPAAQGMTIRRQHNIAFYNNCMNKYQEMGGKIQLETEAYDLIMENGIVCGVKAKNTYDGTEYVIHAKEVVMSTGGFLSNSEMTTKYLSNEYYPLSGTWDMVGMKQNDGVLIESAIEDGAATYNIGMCPAVHIIGASGFLTNFEYHTLEDKLCMQTMKPTKWTEGDLPHYLGVANDSLAVDMTGKRFASEAHLNFDSWQTGTNYFSIYGEQQILAVEERGIRTQPAYMMTVNLGANGWAPAGTPITNAREVMQAGVEAGFIYKADTLEELAKLTGMDAETLKTTVATYNNACETGVDAEFGKPAEMLDAIGSEGPYYAIKMTSYPYSTCGALDVNTNLEVLKTDGTVMEGLFAAGLDASGVLYSEKKPYVTYGGVDQGFAFTSGRTAGKVAAEKARNTK